MPTKKTTTAPATKKSTSAKASAKSPVEVKAVKTGAPKKKATKAKEPKAIVCACVLTCRPEHAFWVNNGPVVDSIEHLKQAFAEMSDEQFRYHTMREGNDFARWIRECLHDVERASRIEKARTKTAACKALESACCK